MSALSGLVEGMAAVAAMSTWRRFMVALAAVSVAASAVYGGFVRIGIYLKGQSHDIMEWIFVDICGLM